MRTLLSSLALLSACATDAPTEMPMPELGVSSVRSARVIRNRTVEVAIEIVRNADLVGPVTIVVDGTPPRVTALPLEIADGETTGILKFVSEDEIALGTTATVTLRAIAGDTVATSELELRLTDRPGTLDTTFGSGGIASARYSVGYQEGMTRVALQPDGKVVAAGPNVQLGLTMVVRYNVDGTLDKDFGDGGFFPGPPDFETVVGITVRPDGTILVVGAKGTTTNLRVLSATGYQVDMRVLPDVAARDIVAMPDGSLYLAGLRGDTAVVLRLGAELMPDPAFDGDGLAVIDFGGGTPEVTSLMRRDDGRLAITGFVQNLSVTHYAAAQLTVDGLLDTSFTGDGLEHYAIPGEIVSANLLPDGRIAAVSYQGQEVTMVGIELDGAIDMAKALPMNMYAATAVSITGGVIVVGSDVDYTAWYVTKFGASGPDTSFGEGGISQMPHPTGGSRMLVDAVPFDADRAFAIGSDTPLGGISQSTVVRFWL